MLGCCLIPEEAGHSRHRAKKDYCDDRKRYRARPVRGIENRAGEPVKGPASWMPVAYRWRCFATPHSQLVAWLAVPLLKEELGNVVMFVVGHDMDRTCAKAACCRTNPWWLASFTPNS